MAGRAYRERALAIARSLPDRALEASILLEEASTAWGQAEYDTAGELARTARSLQEGAGDFAGQSKSVMMLGLSLPPSSVWTWKICPW